MVANWYLVKYAADAFRDEPRNVGVLVTADSGAACRFIGEQAGKIDARSVRSIVNSPEVFKAWVRYIKYHLSSDTLDEAIGELGHRRAGSYRIEHRGYLPTDPTADDLNAVVNELFTDLVSLPGMAHIQRFDDVVDELLFERLAFPAGRQIERDVSYTVDVRVPSRDAHLPLKIEFPFCYVHDGVVLLDKLNLTKPNKSTFRRVNDLLFRAEHIIHSKVNQNGHKLRVNRVVTLYDAGSGPLDENLDLQLDALNRFSETVNVRDADAAENVGHKLGVLVK